MRKEQYFIITTVIVGIITALPKDEVVFVDSSQLSAAGSSNFASKLPSQSTCGLRKAPSFRILGGSDSQLGAWPWMVALGYKNDVNKDSIDWLCSGTLISNTHVLTASSCVTNIGKRALTVARLGDLNLDPTIDDGATPLDVPIERIIPHKEFNSRNMTNDIALLVLKNIINFTEFIQPICLPLSPSMDTIDMGNGLSFIAGWGNTEFRGKMSSSLKEVRLPIRNITDCKNAYTSKVIDDRIICAGEEGKDTCKGDSGAPLMWFKEKQFYLMGITSFGSTYCGLQEYPGVYTRVPSFLKWILESINNN